jgi:hypothetical protein
MYESHMQWVAKTAIDDIARMSRVTLDARRVTHP